MFTDIILKIKIKQLIFTLWMILKHNLFVKPCNSLNTVQPPPYMQYLSANSYNQCYIKDILIDFLQEHSNADFILIGNLNLFIKIRRLKTIDEKKTKVKSRLLLIHLSVDL